MAVVMAVEVTANPKTEVTVVKAMEEAAGGIKPKPKEKNYWKKEKKNWKK